MTTRDELWLEHALEVATRRVAIPPAHRWLPSRPRALLPRDDLLRHALVAGTAFALLLALLYGAGRASHPSSDAVLGPPAHVFSARDAGLIVIQYDEPPAGMRLDSMAAGEVALQAPFRVGCARSSVPGDDFRDARSTTFVRIGGEESQASFAAVYADAASASEAYRALASCFQRLWFPQQAPTDPSLGAEGVFFSATSITGYPYDIFAWDTNTVLKHHYQNIAAVVYFWRVDNLLLLVADAGASVDLSAVQATVHKMAERAAR